MSIVVNAYTGGRDLPSARFRIRQYVEPLRRCGLELREHWLPWGNRRPRYASWVPFWYAASIANRALGSVDSYRGDVTLISRQFVPLCFPIESLTKRPRVLDVDDAIWLNRGGGRVSRISQRCEAVICGNEFLAEYFRRWNDNVYVLPTGVDTGRIRPNRSPGSGERTIIGWIGSAENLAYVSAIEPALCAVLGARREAEFLVVSNARPQLPSLPKTQLRFVPWSRAAEVEALAEMSIGIMPLADSEWTRGKCGFKMLTYMAAAVPVVVSPVGMNQEILARGHCGLPATTQKEWTAAILDLASSLSTRAEMGKCGRSIIEKEFSVEQLVPRLASILKQVAG